MVSPAACGFPSPADDNLDRRLDFNELLTENPAATPEPLRTHLRASLLRRRA
jgi:hypothetical protein